MVEMFGAVDLVAVRVRLNGGKQAHDEVFVSLFRLTWRLFSWQRWRWWWSKWRVSAPVRFSVFLFSTTWWMTTTICFFNAPLTRWSQKRNRKEKDQYAYIFSWNHQSCNFLFDAKNPSNYYSQVIEVTSKCQQMTGSVNVYWYSTYQCLYAYIMNVMIIWFLSYYSRSYRGSYGNNYSSKILQPIESTWFLGFPSYSCQLSLRKKIQMRRTRRHWRAMMKETFFLRLFVTSRNSATDFGIFSLCITVDWDEISIL